MIGRDVFDFSPGELQSTLRNARELVQHKRPCIVIRQTKTSAQISLHISIAEQQKADGRRDAYRGLAITAQGNENWAAGRQICRASVA